MNGLLTIIAKADFNVEVSTYGHGNPIGERSLGITTIDTMPLWWTLACISNRILKLLIPLLAIGWLRAAEIQLAVSKFDLNNVNAEVVTYRGSPALKFTEKETGAAEAMAIVKDLTFHNGVIDLYAAGAPSTTAGEGARGFIGVAFRMQSNPSRYEIVYVRPTNARAADQLRRNHTTQYVSFPDWPWERLRKETPGVYESYTDMGAGEWTHLRIVVTGTDASLYAGDAREPCLLVHDLKLGDKEGKVALWIGPGTVGYFRDLKVTSDH